MPEAHTTGVPSKYYSPLPFLLTPHMLATKEQHPWPHEAPKSISCPRRCRDSQESRKVTREDADEQTGNAYLSSRWPFLFTMAISLYDGRFSAQCPVLCTMSGSLHNVRFSLRCTFLFTMTVPVDRLEPDYVISALEEFTQSLITLTPPKGIADYEADFATIR